MRKGEIKLIINNNITNEEQYLGSEKNADHGLVCFENIHYDDDVFIFQELKHSNNFGKYLLRVMHNLNSGELTTIYASFKPHEQRGDNE